MSLKLVIYSEMWRQGWKKKRYRKTAMKTWSKLLPQTEKKCTPVLQREGSWAGRLFRWSARMRGKQGGLQDGRLYTCQSRNSMEDWRGLWRGDAATNLSCSLDFGGLSLSKYLWQLQGTPVIPQGPHKAEFNQVLERRRQTLFLRVLLILFQISMLIFFSNWLGHIFRSEYFAWLEILTYVLCTVHF